MTVYPVTSPEFARYGRVITGYEDECASVASALETCTPLPEDVGYLPEEPALQFMRKPPRWGHRCSAVCPFSSAGATATISS